MAYQTISILGCDIRGGFWQGDRGWKTAVRPSTSFFDSRNILYENIHADQVNPYRDGR